MSKKINLNEKEKDVLRILEESSAIDGEMCVSFAYIAYNKRDIKAVRRACRSLRRKGLAEYYRGLMTDEGEVAGSGYCITLAGIEILNPDE